MRGQVILKKVAARGSRNDLTTTGGVKLVANARRSDVMAIVDSDGQLLERVR